MNILLISQCGKRALTETRRVLHQFAERRGDRSWQTPITQQGLDTLRKLLKKTARRNTAVACHWIRGQDHSELLWVVGDASQFNEQGGRHDCAGGGGHSLTRAAGVMVSCRLRGS